MNLKYLMQAVLLKAQEKLRLFPKMICLISGAPRSGTSALYEWLGHHKDIAAFSESPIFIGAHAFMEQVNRFQNLENEIELLTNLACRLVYDYYSRAKDYQKFIANYRRMFTQSKLLFVVRDPIATIWSMSTGTWGESLVNQATKEFTLEEYAENWCSCVNLILSYRSDPNTYILQYERLVRDPETESKKTFDFLKITSGCSFQPRQTKEIGFTHHERDKILHLVRLQLKQLSAQRILYPNA